MMHGAFEKTVVVRPAHRNDVILGGFGRDGLEELLQFAFGVFENRDYGEPAERSLEMPENEVAGRLEATIEKDRAQQRLVSIGQRRGPLAAAMQLLPMARGSSAGPGPGAGRARPGCGD